MKNLLNEKSNIPKFMKKSLMYSFYNDKNQIIYIQNLFINERRNKEKNDISSEDRNFFNSNCGLLFKSDQLIKLHLPSSSHVVRGIEHGGLYYHQRRSRDWFRISAGCVSRISNRISRNQVLLRGQCISSRRNGRHNVHSLAFGAIQLRQLLKRQLCEKRKEVSIITEDSSRKQTVDPLSSNTKITRKRRVGIVENQYAVENNIGSSVCDLVRGLERLFDEKNAGNNKITMKSKKEQNAEEDVVDPVEENETYDEFDTIRIPIVRSLSKSPPNDEGIETDSDRRKGSIARCWSLDSTAASDEDISLTTHQQKRHKLRVTRCYSSDSAVLSDEDQIKGEEDGMPLVALFSTLKEEGRIR